MNQSRRGLAWAVAGALASGLVAACTEETPVTIREDVLPGSPVTVSIEVPWEEFGSDLQLFGGFGFVGDIGRAVLATDFADTLNSRALFRFGEFPQDVIATDTLGTTRTDRNIDFVGGRVVITFNEATRLNDEPILLRLSALQQEWHDLSASWEFAVDTVNDRKPWEEPGGGAVIPLDTATWEPLAPGDTISFVLDSAEVQLWADDFDESRGGRVEIVTGGQRADMITAALRVLVRPSINPDTIVEEEVTLVGLTFAYDPLPPPPASDELRVGGAPSWRSVMTMSPPTELNGPQELCDAIGCPVTLAPEDISYAALVMRSRPPPLAFQPVDSLDIDVRSVLDPRALPKAPLGLSLIGFPGTTVPSSAFRDQERSAVELPVTRFVQNLVEGFDTVTQRSFPNTLALLSPLEPLSLSYASFFGPGSPYAPVLKLIVTRGRQVNLP